jgi:hypothetical protein
MAERFRVWRLLHKKGEAGPQSSHGSRGRHAVMLVATFLTTAGAMALTPAHPVAAQDSCIDDGANQGTNGTNWICRWTQMDNNFPYAGSNPDCGAYCAYYLHGSGPQIYNYSDQVTVSANGVNFHSDVQTAVHDWSGQPYRSPWFSNCNCGNGFMTVNDGPTQPNACGVGGVTTAWQAYGATNDNHIVSAVLTFTTNNVNWFDGPPPSTFSGDYCDAQSTAYHEAGHAFSEGHSSYAGDVMYWGGSDNTTIDGDAQNMLDAVYGPYNGQGSGTCSSCQTLCPPQSQGVRVGGTVYYVPTPFCAPLYGYLSKAWDLSQGVPHPNPVDYATPPPSGCLTYWYGDQFENWVVCVETWYRAHP